MSGGRMRSGRAAGYLRRHGEWVFAVAALVVTSSALLGADPAADATAYIVSAFGVEIMVIGVFVVWLSRGDRWHRGRPAIGFVGIPVAVYVAMVPGVLAGRLNDDSTGTVASLLLTTLIVAACVPLGMLVGFLVLLPAGAVLVGLALAASGRIAGLAVALVAAFPLVVVGAGVVGALAMDDVPQETGPWQAAGGVAMLARAFGVDNGVRIVDPTAVSWFRVLAVIALLYLVGLVAAARDRPTRSERG